MRELESVHSLNAGPVEHPSCSGTLVRSDCEKFLSMTQLSCVHQSAVK